MIIPHNQIKAFSIGPIAFVRLSDFRQGEQIESLLVAFTYSGHGIEIRLRPHFLIRRLFR